jgi:hypothetical protein
MEIHFIKKQVVSLSTKYKKLGKYQEINYWGKMMTKTRSYQVIVGIPCVLERGVNGLDFWVSQDLTHWTKLPPVTHNLIRNAE